VSKNVKSVLSSNRDWFDFASLNVFYLIDDEESDVISDILISIHRALANEQY
jgi:hypothetical protein